MLVLNTRLSNIPIQSLQTGTVVGYTKEPIIDPRQLNVVAFYCTGTHLNGTAILHVSDIREVGSLGIIVDSAESIMPPDDLVRLQEIINFHFALIGKPVVDTHHTSLGKVETYGTDLQSFYIRKLNIKQPALRNFWGNTLLIDRTQVVEVSDEHITVNAPDIRSKIADHTSQLLGPNPFRRPQPHTDSAPSPSIKDN
jgi:uncharacterized protein YrrD